MLRPEKQHTVVPRPNITLLSGALLVIAMAIIDGVAFLYSILLSTESHSKNDLSILSVSPALRLLAIVIILQALAVGMMYYRKWFVPATIGLAGVLLLALLAGILFLLG